MSSSTDTTLLGARVVRDATSATAPVLQDLDALSPAARRVVDPEALAEATARGYEDGRAEGYADGLAAGRAAALEDAARQQAEGAARIEQAVTALHAAVADAARRHEAAVVALEEVLVSGAFELAEALLGRELELATDPGRDAVRRALRLAEGSEPVSAHLHPDDIATLGDLDSLAPGRALTVIPDAAVERGGCVLQVGSGRVDARLGAALERVRQVLGS